MQITLFVPLPHAWLDIVLVGLVKAFGFFLTTRASLSSHTNSSQTTYQHTVGSCRILAHTDHILPQSSYLYKGTGHHLPRIVHLLYLRHYIDTLWK